MTSDGAALFRAICEQPWEDAPRLVYADWLDENGQPERAAFIRFQCEFPEWDKWDSAHPRFQELTARLRRFEPHFKEWKKALPRLKRVQWWGTLWKRGFIYGVDFPYPKSFADHADAAFAAAPIQHVKVGRVTDGTVERVLASGYLKRLNQLILAGSYGPGTVRATAACANLTNVTHLCLWGGCTDDGAELLASSPHLGHATCLSLSNHTLTERGLTALIESECLRGVTALILHGTSGLGRQIHRRLQERFETVG
jgi:uncharacterized protein (TIGR02996 family)